MYIIYVNNKLPLALAVHKISRHFWAACGYCALTDHCSLQYAIYPVNLVNQFKLIFCEFQILDSVITIKNIYNLTVAAKFIHQYIFNNCVIHIIIHLMFV